MHEATVTSYDERGLEWVATHRSAGSRGRAEAFAAAVDVFESGGLRIDMGCGAGRYLPYLGTPALALDASTTMLEACRAELPGAVYIRADVEHLPFRRHTLAGAWSWMTHHHLPSHRLPLALGELHRVLRPGAPLSLQVLYADDEGPAGAGDPVPGRYFAGWSPERLVAVVEGAGFLVDRSSVEVEDDELRLSAISARTLADTVAPGMRLLVCGINPSPYSADVGVGYGRPGNRFWAAALAAGLVTRDRDPLAALLDHGMGMSDVVKRATPRAAEVTAEEYRAGFQRLSSLVEWLQPAAVCFVGLSGWRTVVDRRAKAGAQAQTIGGRPVYLMPSTSGLNAHATPALLAEHLRAAADLADRHRRDGA